MIDALLRTLCPHEIRCEDHDACCESKPHLPGHLHCVWCGHCTACHPHDCIHQGEPCSRCGTSVRDRPKPTWGDHRGMCQPPAIA